MTDRFINDSPYTPLPAHAAKMLDAAQKRIAELEERHQAATAAFLDANGKGFASGMHYADEKILKLECEIAASYERGARGFAEWCDGNVNAVRTGPNQYETIKMMCARFLASRGTGIAESNGEEG